jgi:hypothetical protein
MSDPQPVPPPIDSAAGERFGYFMVRIRRTERDPSAGFSAVIERIGTGEKREVRSSSELVAVVEEWSR